MSWKCISKFPLILLLSIVGFILLNFIQFEGKQLNSKAYLGFWRSATTIAAEPQLTQLQLLQHPKIQVYFNQNQANTYTDSYRRVSRFGDNLEAIVIAQITSAHKSIDIAVTGISLPGVAQALVERYKAGVKIRWITDNDYVNPWGSLTIDEVADLDSDEQDLWVEYDDLIDADKDGELSPEEVAEREVYTLFNSHGIPWLDDTADGSKGSDLMHHKFIVIDGQKTITGSANFTLSGMHGDMGISNSLGNIENLVVIDSPELAALYTQEFDLMWGDGPGGKLDSLFGLQKPDRATQSVQVGDAQIQIHFSPTSAGVPYAQTSGGMIAAALNQSRKRIDLAQFVFSDQVKGCQRIRL